MKSLSFIAFTLVACQVPKSHTIEDIETQESNVEYIEDEETMDSLHDFPEILVCSTRPFVRDFTGKPYVYRFEITNVYGLAKTNIELDTLHPAEGALSLAQMQYQVLPELEEDTFYLQFSEESMLSGDPTIFSHEHDATAHLFLTKQPKNLYTGLLNTFGQFDLETHCWDPNQEFEFQYNENTGSCENEHGVGGMNESSLIQVRETENAECVVLDNWNLNEEDYSYPNLPWNLRGAVLRSSIHFANMINADFRGSDLSALDFGYSQLKGPIDDFTLLPEGCLVQDNMIDCIR